jgi:small subunit ribosomal protein S3
LSPNIGVVSNTGQGQSSGPRDRGGDRGGRRREGGGGSGARRGGPRRNG